MEISYNRVMEKDNIVRSLVYKDNNIVVLEARHDLATFVSDEPCSTSLMAVMK
jgi:hypothetical protein